MLIQISLIILVLITALISGLYLRNSTKEELKAGRKWFKLLMGVSLAIAVIIVFVPIENKLKISYAITLIIIAVISYISWKK